MLAACEPTDRVANGNQHSQCGNSDHDLAAARELVAEVASGIAFVRGRREQHRYLCRRRNKYEQDDGAAMLAHARNLPEIEVIPPADGRDARELSDQERDRPEHKCGKDAPWFDIAIHGSSFSHCPRVARSFSLMSV